jgi:diketogulonate reductase-like aldo/keto reductase
MSGRSDRLVHARGGLTMPRLGQGTWRMAERSAARKAEVAALKVGLDLGMTLIDTAEMYGSGGAEEIVAEAIQGRREEVFLVSKVLPENASRQGTIAACERSLKRLKTDRIDLYLLHWQVSHSLAETLEAFERLVEGGKIRFFGVSNFDCAGMKALERLRSGPNVVCNQVMYAPSRRGIEWDLLPWCEKNKVAVMAYSPLDRGRLAGHPALAAIGVRHNVASEAISIAWTMRAPMLVSIPKASDPAHVKANAAALELELSPEDLSELDRAFPPPRGAGPLDIV